MVFNKEIANAVAKIFRLLGLKFGGALKLGEAMRTLRGAMIKH